MITSGYSFKNKVKILETTHQITIPFGAKSSRIQEWLSFLPKDAVITDWYFDDDTHHLIVEFRDVKQENQ